MAAAATLAHFVQTALVKFPADHYMLEISDHGGAWMGAVEDFDNGTTPIMTLDSMQQALVEVLNGIKLDIISFDACLMASQTVAAALQPVARYLISSELSIMVEGQILDPWNHGDHVPFSADLGRSQFAEEYGTAIVNSFADCGGSDKMQTMSLVALESYPTFAQAMEGVARALLEAVLLSIEDERIVTAVAAVNSLNDDYGLMHEEDNDMGDFGADIGSFLRRWIEALGERASEQAKATAVVAQQALNVYDAMIVHERHTENDRNAYSGMHIFFPANLATSRNAREFLGMYESTNPIINDGLDSIWHQFIFAYGAAVGDGCSRDFVDTGTIDESSGYDADLDCHWSLSCTNSSLHPTLKFVSFSTEGNFDYVNIFDGGSLDSPRIMHASGHGIPDVVSGNSEEILMQFVTDSSGTDAGFVANFTCGEYVESHDPTICRYANDDECDEPAYCRPGTDAADCTGGADSFTDDTVCRYANDGACDEPAYCQPGTDAADCATSASDYSDGGQPCVGPALALVDSGILQQSGGYSDSFNCRWTLSCADPSLHPTLVFISFSTETDFDFVDVFDGDAPTESLRVLHASGHSTPDAVSGSHSEMFVQFTTDDSQMDDGFVAHFACGSSIRVTRAGLTNVDGVFTHTNLPTYSGPPVYAMGQLAIFRWAHTHWVLSDVGPNMDSFAEDEWLYEVESSADTPPLTGWVAVAKGAEPVPNFEPSEAAPTLRGMDPCSGSGRSLRDETNIDLSDGYSNGMDCHWLLTCSDLAMHPKITFNSFGTETDFDFVSIFDGTVDGKNLLLRASGGSTPDPVSASGTQMAVHFTSDDSVSDSVGFSAHVLCTSAQKAVLGRGKIFPQRDKPPVSTLTFLNGTLKNDGNGNVLISVLCPSYTVDANVWTGVVDHAVRSSIHESGVETLWSLEPKGTTVKTRTSVVDIWWTSAHSASLAYSATKSAVQTTGTWDGLSETLSQTYDNAAHKSFVFSRNHYVSTDRTDAGEEVIVSVLEVVYYAPDPSSSSGKYEVPTDGSGGQRSTLRTSYTETHEGGFRLIRQVLSTKIDKMVEQVIPTTAGGMIVPILYGSKQDSDGLPVGRPKPYLYQPSDSAMRWGPTLRLGREPVLEDFGDAKLVSSKEVLMLEVEGIRGETNTFAGLFDDGVLEFTTSPDTGQVSLP
jgi:hypothetical protein